MVISQNLQSGARWLILIFSRFVNMLRDGNNNNNNNNSNNNNNNNNCNNNNNNNSNNNNDFINDGAISVNSLSASQISTTSFPGSLILSPMGR